MKIEKFHKNEIIIKKGMRGDTFFIVIEGKARAFDENPESGEIYPLTEYHEKMYFGELVLIREQPRSMNVIALVGLKD